jgi:uncharacterized membrane-anchored protein
VITEKPAVWKQVLPAARVFVLFRASRYLPCIYRLAVVLISIVGTLPDHRKPDRQLRGRAADDNHHFRFGSDRDLHRLVCPRSLSIHSIYTPLREAFHGLQILFTFALGTAADALIAKSFGLGYLTSAILVAALTAVVATAHYRLRLNALRARCIAYILTHPLRASLGDYFSQSAENGGLGTVVTGAIILVGS